MDDRIPAEIDQSLVSALRERFELPVDTPRRLAEGTMTRFVNWHDARVGGA
jgi:hypothetical protein